jgi:hypothetical protein
MRIPTVKDADLFLEHSKSLLAGAIRLATGSFWNHAGLIFIMTRSRLLYCRLILGKALPQEEWLGQACVIEAVGKGVIIARLEDRIDEGSLLMVARRRGLTDVLASAVVSTALGFLGQAYGVRRLLAWLVDLVFRRNQKAGEWINTKMGLDLMICSLLVAFAFWVIGILFKGKLYRLVSPDDIGDEVEENIEDWEIVLRETV